MRRNYQWCEECLARAKGFLVPEDQDASCVQNRMHRDDGKLDSFVLARDTGAQLEEKATWHQEPINGKRPIVWRPEHRLYTGTMTVDGYGGRPYVHHIEIRNRDASRAHRVFLCSLPETIQLTGPGAEAHIEADAEEVATQLAKDDLTTRTKARAKAESAEAEAFGDQLVAILKTLGIEITSSSSHGFFHREDDPLKPENFTVSMTLDVAARVAEALGGTVTRPPQESIPLWKVWYGEERKDGDEPTYVAARTKPAVIAHMTSSYCHERTKDDKPNVPLKTELLTIEDAGTDPVVTVDSDEENVA